MTQYVLSNSKIASSNVALIELSEPIAEEETNGVYVGKTLVYKAPFFLDNSRLLNPHIAVIGQSGSGKTYFLKSYIIRSSLDTGAKVLIIDWNGEYEEVISFLGGTSIKLGMGYSINIFELFNGEEQKSASHVTNAVTAMLKLNNDEQALLHGIVINAINYAKTIGRAATLSDVLSIIDLEGSDAAKGLKTKLKQLVGSSIFADSTNFDVKAVLDGAFSINLVYLPNDVQRRLVASALIDMVIEFMHSMEISNKTRRILFLDEAWKLLGDNRNLGQLFREGRKYGIGIAIATQLAKDINNEMIANAACLVVFRLQSGDDYNVLIDTGIIEETFRGQLSNLPIGRCLMRLAYKESSSKAATFFIKKIDGFSTTVYTFKSGKMQLKISSEQFARLTDSLIQNPEVKNRIVNFIEANERSIDSTSLVKLLMKNGLKRADIVTYMRLLGFDDMTIVGSYESAKGLMIESEMK